MLYKEVGTLHWLRFRFFKRLHIESDWSKNYTFWKKILKNRGFCFRWKRRQTFMMLNLYYFGIINLLFSRKAPHTEFGMALRAFLGKRSLTLILLIFNTIRHKILFFEIKKLKFSRFSPKAEIPFTFASYNFQWRGLGIKRNPRAGFLFLRFS